MSRLSLSEKVGQVNQHLYGWDCYEYQGGEFELTKSFKEHVRWGEGLGALYGLFRADPWSKVDYNNGIPVQESWKVANQIQEYVINHSRWGIPALIVEECPHGHQALDSISYPTNIGRGSTFNTQLIEETSHLMAKELAAKGVHIALVSTLDLAKDPRWGRSEECFGEDPILSARMSEAVIKGFQGNLISDEVDFLDQRVSDINKSQEQIGVVLKHCIAQGEALGGHNSGTVPIGRREFADVYMPILKSARNAVGVMAAYNDIDGVPCHVNQTLLGQHLRNESGFQGFVMADGIALDRLSDVYQDPIEAAGQALIAGVDLSLWDDTYTKIETGVVNGTIDKKLLDHAVSRVLAVKFLLGLFDNPFVQPTDHKLLVEESRRMNEEVAKESLVLLRNNGILPLNPKGKKIAVIGPNAKNIYHLLGDYSAPQSRDQQQKTILQALKDTMNGAEIMYAEGCEVRNEENQELKIEEALKLALEADVIITVLGGSSARNFDMEFLQNGAVTSKGINMDSGENVDVASLSLGGKQELLLRKLAVLQKPIVTILIQGRPYDLTLVEECSDAVLVGWFPGQEGGQAIAKTLIGENNPSGRLGITYPRNSSQLPVYYYQRDASKQDDYYDLSGRPLHEFGEGLSYTTFTYDELAYQRNVDKLQVSVKVRNSGSLAGKVITLLFIKLLDGSVIQRKKMLKDFCKVTLESKEEKTIVFTLSSDDFRYMGADDCWHYSKKVKIMIGDLAKEIDLN
ncbi:glycoside hydrolase family 3 N-terminal domain-containing protein [Enterococcus sp. OL5]|uniref:glycoside hydrolase family 3 N-terminal domain-containing protein n=1 Tax=Enterococcus sp. OL5 TaxID=2590214 RepID=UPI0011290947|nr:glycoside hydrolase family 3 N-terminal domain-containing protein [Enterococcus sp. OL5]TPR55137.1 family 3 glycosyl hydrolase [Enterococcus sp. OL5]